MTEVSSILQNLVDMQNEEIRGLNAENDRMRSALMMLANMEKPCGANADWNSGFEAALVDVSKLARFGLG